MRMLKAPFWGLVLLSNIVISATASGSPEERAEEEVTEQLEMLMLSAAFRGYEPVSEPWLTWLDEDEGDENIIELYEDQDYMVVAVCNDDCGHIGIALFDDNGELLEENESDDAPADVAGLAPYTGMYQIAVGMLECDREPCLVGAMAFRRVEDD